LIDLIDNPRTPDSQLEEGLWHRLKHTLAQQPKSLVVDDVSRVLELREHAVGADE
jgi:hypothetical protein